MVEIDLAIWGPVIMVVQGGRLHLGSIHDSTIVRMASYPLLLGSPVMRSIVMCENGLASGPMGFEIVVSLVVRQVLVLLAGCTPLRSLGSKIVR